MPNIEHQMMKEKKWVLNTETMNAVMKMILSMLTEVQIELMKKL
jgi:hypothetical protein